MSFPPVADRLTRLPDVDDAKRAPLQSVEPAGRKTMVLPAEAKDPRTCTVVRVLAGMAEGLKSMSGGIGGGGEGREAAAVMVGAATAREVEAAALQAVLLPQRRS